LILKLLELSRKPVLGDLRIFLSGESAYKNLISFTEFYSYKFVYEGTLIKSVTFP